MIVSKISQVIIYWPLVFMSACNPFWELLYSISLKLSSKVILWTRPLSWFDFIGLHITCMTDIHLLVKQTIQLWTYLLLKSQEFILISPFLPQGKASRLKEVPVVEYVFPRIQTFPWKHRFHYWRQRSPVVPVEREPCSILSADNGWLATTLTFLLHVKLD